MLHFTKSMAIESSSTSGSSTTSSKENMAHKVDRYIYNLDRSKLTMASTVSYQLLHAIVLFRNMLTYFVAALERLKCPTADVAVMMPVFQELVRVASKGNIIWILVDSVLAASRARDGLPCVFEEEVTSTIHPHETAMAKTMQDTVEQVRDWVANSNAKAAEIIAIGMGMEMKIHDFIIAYEMFARAA